MPMNLSALSRRAFSGRDLRAWFSVPETYTLGSVIGTANRLPENGNPRAQRFKDEKSDKVRAFPVLVPINAPLPVPAETNTPHHRDRSGTEKRRYPAVIGKVPWLQELSRRDAEKLFLQAG